MYTCDITCQLTKLVYLYHYDDAILPRSIRLKIIKSNWVDSVNNETNNVIIIEIEQIFKTSKRMNNYKSFTKEKILF